MENSFQTSFIPKKPVVSSGNFNKEPKSLFYIISVFLLVVSVVVSIGLFVYKIYLTKQRDSASASLAIVRDSFEKDTIDVLSSFDKKTESAKQVLNNHIVLSSMFSLLGEITIPTIQYVSFSQLTDGGNTLVKIDGVARDYRSIALQADVFSSSKGRLFKNVIFSNLVKDKNNNIVFNLEFNVDPSLLSYQKNISTNNTKTPTQNTLPQDLTTPTQ
jgi:hypothetical protein